MGKPALVELPPSPQGKDSEVSVFAGFPPTEVWLPLSHSTCALPEIPLGIRDPPTPASASGLFCPLQPEGSGQGQAEQNEDRLAQGWDARPQAVLVTF